MDRRPPSVRLACALACALACRPPAAPAQEPVPSTLSQPPVPSTLSLEPRPAPGPPAPEAPPAPLDPELQALLSGAFEPPPPPAEVVDPRSPCHPDRPDTPYERSLCICESACARTVDRAQLARGLYARTGDRAAAERWLRERAPTTLHYPYTDTDGLRIHVDGDGRVTRCSHSVNFKPGSAVALECSDLVPRGHRSPVQ